MCILVIIRREKKIHILPPNNTLFDEGILKF